MAEAHHDIVDDEDVSSTAVKVVLAAFLAVAVFIGGWWLLQGPSARLTPTDQALQSQQEGSPGAAPDKGPPGGLGTNPYP